MNASSRGTSVKVRATQCRTGNVSASDSKPSQNGMPNDAAPQNCSGADLERVIAFEQFFDLQRELARAASRPRRRSSPAATCACAAAAHCRARSAWPRRIAPHGRGPPCRDWGRGPCACTAPPPGGTARDRSSPAAALVIRLTGVLAVDRRAAPVRAVRDRRAPSTWSSFALRISSASARHLRKRRSIGSLRLCSMSSRASTMRCTSGHATFWTPCSRRRRHQRAVGLRRAAPRAPRASGANSRSSCSCSGNGRPLLAAADGQAKRRPTLQWSPAGTSTNGNRRHGSGLRLVAEALVNAAAALVAEEDAAAVGAVIERGSAAPTAARGGGTGSWPPRSASASQPCASMRRRSSSVIVTTVFLAAGAADVAVPVLHDRQLI